MPDQDEYAPFSSTYFRHIGLQVFGAVLLIIAYAVIPPFPVVQHLLLVLIAVLIIHILERVFLWKEVWRWHKAGLAEAIRASNAITVSSAACGLTSIFSSRRDPDLRNEVRLAIEQARKRIWLLGVVLAEDVSLGDLKRVLRDKPETTDIRILMLHAYRSPAVFRTFLESTPRNLSEIVGMDPVREHSIRRLLQQRLYTKLTALLADIQSPRLTKCVKFYAHTPSCWLAIVDDVAYFQPYTLGRSPGQHPEELSLGPHMPVFKFQLQADSHPFKIIEDHFDRLWLTSDVDLFHFRAQELFRDDILEKMFKERQPWFHQVYWALNNKERRKHPRQDYSSARISVTLDWMAGTEPVKAQANIEKTAIDSMTVVLDKDYKGPVPIKGIHITVTAGQPVSEQAKYILTELLKAGPQFTVRRIIDEDKKIIALTPDARQQAYMGAAR